MSLDHPLPRDPSPKTREQVIAEFFREMERLRQLKGDSRDELDEFQSLPIEVSSDLTAEDISNSVPGGPVFEAILRRLESP